MPRLEIRTKDLRRIAAAVDRAHIGTPGEGLPYSVLNAINDLVPCDCVCFNAIDYRRKTWLIEQEQEGIEPMNCLETDPARLEELYWHTFRTSMSCSYQYWTGDYTRVARATDFYPSQRAYFSSDIGELMRLFHSRFSVLMPLPPNGPVNYEVLLFRDTGSDFTEREQLLLGLLRPHLAEMYAEIRRLRVSHGLTPRQTQLVDLVAQGLTNRQVATRLRLAEGTVRTHMEHVFERLEVSSRAAAVARLGETRANAGP